MMHSPTILPPAPRWLTHARRGLQVAVALLAIGAALSVASLVLHLLPGGGR